MLQRRIALLAPMVFATMAAAQDTVGDWKLQSDLRAAMAKAEDGAKLPVYFVMRDRLGYNHWFPRVNMLDLDERRALVVRELKAHARKTQAGLLSELNSAQDRGQVDRVSSNWVGNFVRARATTDVIHAATARDDVWEIWPDFRSPLAAIEDGALLPQGGPTLTPGNGPADVGADRVWALGFRGQGLVVMNADSGINPQHRTLSNNLWQNPGEIVNGIDDDGNGFIDDINGWNFQDSNADINDNGGHGTNTAGVLVADDSCNRVAYGVAPFGRVMTGKIWTQPDHFDAIQYAIQMGAHTMTSSHSYKNTAIPPPDYRMHRDIADMTLAVGLFRTNSTSNNGGACQGPIQSLMQPFNVSVPGNSPPPYLDPAQTLVSRKSGVIGVGAYNVGSEFLYSGSPCGPAAWHLDELLVALPTYPIAQWNPIMHNDYPWMGGAQLGLLKPDILGPTGTQTAAAPGAVCTIGNFGGTSNSTPIVAGCAMLWKCANMSLLPEDLAMILHQTARDVGTVPGKENTWGAGIVDAYEGVKLALAVHRVNGEPAWQITHQSGSPITLAVDGSEGKGCLIAVGLTRQEVSLGVVSSGIGNQLFEAYCGSTGVSGTVRVTFPVPRVTAPVTVYSQVFLDDTAGPTGQLLTSNVIGIRVIP